jgi:hypothetical protein
MIGMDVVHKTDAESNVVEQGRSHTVQIPSLRDAGKFYFSPVLILLKVYVYNRSCFTLNLTCLSKARSGSRWLYALTKRL